MPSANELLQNLDSPEQPPPPSAEEDPWGFNTPPSATEHIGTAKKKKGKKKLRKNAAPALPESPPEAARVEDNGGDESATYPESVAPSPPREQGVKLDTHTGSPSAVLGTSPLASEPLVNLDDDDSPPMDDLEPALLHRPPTEPPPAAASPSIRSPRPALVEPAIKPPRTSPSTRPSTLHNRHDSTGSAYRPPALLKGQPPPRRESFNAAGPFPRFVEPPPPHMPQAHFFGLPDFALNLNRKPDLGRPAGSDGYCCSLDSLADGGEDTSARKAKDVLLVGSDGAMEVYRVLPGKLEVVGRVEGLRGAVLKAKILPCPDLSDPLQSLRPLVAVVIHGPVQGEADTLGGVDDETRPTEFQTTVEVYSLLKQTHVATLYRGNIVTAEQPALGQASSLPRPVGDLHLSANGRYIVLASGQSGEVFVFTHWFSRRTTEDDAYRFRCVGKLWTSLQRPVTAHARSSSAYTSGSSGEAYQPRHDPLLSLGQRWLAIVPPVLSSTTSILGSPLLSEDNLNPPGVNSHASPPQPPLNCGVVGTDVEDAWVRLGRQAAQGLVKYSQRGIQMGLHGWKELTQPSPPSSMTHARNPGKDELFPPTKGPSEDPNRHSREPAIVALVDLDGFIRWEEAPSKFMPPTMATFALIDGCNFLSLSSTGTRLLTTSRKGEISHVWDLSQAARGIATRVAHNPDDAHTRRCVRQLHRIVRSTPSAVLSCAWSRDSDALALLTAHGTLHLHEVPARPQVPKKKRPAASRASFSSPSSSSTALEKSTPTTSLSLGLSPPSSNQGFLTTLKSSWQNVSTHVTSLRAAASNPGPGSSAPLGLALPTSFAGFREATAAAGNAGSRAVARGISQGFTAAKDGASDYWHADDNKIRLKALVDSGAGTGTANSVRWVRRASLPGLAVACGGKVHICPVSRVVRRKGEEDVSGLKSERYARKSFALPPIMTGTLGTGGVMGTGGVYAAEGEGWERERERCGILGPHGFWSLKSVSAQAGTVTSPTLAQVRPQASPSQQMKGIPAHRGPSPNHKSLARVMDTPIPRDDEVETNPPYCPFHVDSRVGIFAIDEESYHAPASVEHRTLADYLEQGQGGGDDGLDPWIPGSTLPVSRRVNESDMETVFFKSEDGLEELEAMERTRGTGAELGSQARLQMAELLGMEGELSMDSERDREMGGFPEGGDGEEAVESTVTIQRSRGRSGGQIRVNTRRKIRESGDRDEGEMGEMDEI